MSKLVKTLSVHASAVIVACIVAGSALADVGAVSPTSKPFGRSFEELSAEWWQLVLSIPADINPLFDATGERCAIGQHGPIWFLFGTLGGNAMRTCTVPGNVPLYFPVINTIDINLTAQTAKELRAEIAPCLDAATGLAVKVDGVPLALSLKKNRVLSIPFAVTTPPGGLLDPGVYSPAVDDGFYMMLDPLDPGSHTLHFTGTVPAAVPGCVFQDGWAVDVTYTLNVAPVQLK